MEARWGLVVTSPYIRCVETAAEIAMAVKAPLLLDREYGAQWRINQHRRCL